MDNFQNSQVKKDLQLNESLEASKIKTQKIDNNSLITNNKNNNSYQPKNLPVLEDIIKNNEELTLTQNEKTKRKNKEKVDEESKEDSSMKSRKDSSSKRNKKTIKKRKPKKEKQIGGTIKVVGKISNKLQSLIERLGQNAAKENESNTKKEKYVTGSNVKDALERIRKMKEEEERKKIFVKSKFIWVDVPDSNEVKKEEPKLNNIRDFKKDDKNDIEEDEEEEEEEDDESEENHKNKKSTRKTMPELTFERFINSKDENNKEKKKRKKRKKKDKELKPLKENSSEDRDDSDNDKLNKKKKKRRHKKENNSKNESGEESEESEDENDEKNKKGNKKSKKKKILKKEKTFNFSESEGSEEKNDNNEDPNKIRVITKQKSKALIITKSKDGKYIFSSSSSQSSCSNFNQSVEKDVNSFEHNKGEKTSENNPINISSKKKNETNEKHMLSEQKKLVKNIEYDKFSYKQYTVKNYHPKPVTIWKKQIKKYVLCQQIYFSLISKINKKHENKKIVMFNINNNTINKKKININNKTSSRKSVAISINNNSFHNFEKKYNMNKFDDKFPNIQKMTNTFRIEDKNNNNEFSNKRKRYQSIILPGDSSVNDISKKFNRTINNNKIQKSKIIGKKNKRMSAFQVINKRGLSPDFQENTYIDSIEAQDNKKIKLNGTSSKSKNDEDIINKYEHHPEKEKDEELIKETHFGVKYIVFQNKNDLKKIYKKEKWKLSIRKIVSIFLKAIKKKEVKTNINSKDIHINNIKNNENLEKIQKNKFDINNNKIEKSALNYKAEKNREYKAIDFSNEDSESSEDSKTISIKNIQKNLNNKFNKATLNKKEELQKLNKKGEKRPTNNEKLFMNFNSNINYDKETKRNDRDVIENSKNEGNFNYIIDNYGLNYLSDNKHKRRDNKNLTIETRKARKNEENIFEEKEKKIGRVKSKKAKIRIFKSVKDEPDPSDDERRRKGNLYDYYSGKLPKKRKKYLKNENEKEKEDTTFNSRTIKNDNIKYEYNTLHYKSKSLKSPNAKYENKTHTNNSTPKKQKNQKTIIYHIGKNTSLISTYRQKLFEEFFNKNNISTTNIRKKNNKDAINKSMSELRRKNEFKVKINSSIEMIGIDAIKSKMKKRLIEINNKLIDAVDYYNGPIDISCISLKNYNQTIEILKKRALKNGYNCSKCETNFYELSNRFNTFFVKIVKIRNNMLYYLIVKKQ